MENQQQIPQNILEAISASPFLIRVERTGFPETYAQYKLLGFEVEDGWVEIGGTVKSEDCCALINSFPKNWGNAIAKKKGGAP